MSTLPEEDQAPSDKTSSADATIVLGILNANRKIHKRTDTDVAFTREYSRVSNVVMLERPMDCEDVAYEHGVSEVAMK